MYCSHSTHCVPSHSWKDRIWRIIDFNFPALKRGRGVILPRSETRDAVATNVCSALSPMCPQASLSQDCHTSLLHLLR